MANKEEIITEGIKWLFEWMQKSDPDFKGVSLILITVTQPIGEPKARVFDMITNEPPDNVMAILLSAMGRVSNGEAKTIIVPRTSPQ